MKKQSFTILVTLFLLMFSISLTAQTKSTTTPKDYASYPYWMEMMQDPNGNFFETQKAFYTYWEGRSATRGTGFKPFKRWEYYWQSRVNPDGSYPAPDKVYSEYNNYMESHPEQAGLKTGQATWVALGPTSRTDFGGYNGVGRVNAIAFSPTDTATVYIGAPKGGFWTTHDSGKTWTTSTDKMPTLGVSAILVNKTNPNSILIGTGDRDGGNSGGMGVFRSIDGGLTWAASNTGMGNYTIGMFEQCSTDANLILAAGNGGIFKTTDGGVNWVKTSPDGSDYRDVKFRPGSATIAYAVSGNGFYRSIDGGTTWTLSPATTGYPTGGRLVIGVTPANDSLVYLVGGADKFQGCFVSRNFGASFATASTTPNILGYEYDGSDAKSQAWYDLDIQVDPYNAQTLLVGGVNIWKSIDGGKTWLITSHWWGDRTNEVHADQHTMAYNSINNRIYAGNDGGVYYTSNLGGTWKEISEGLGIGQFYKIGVSQTDGKKIAGGLQDNGSATWNGTNWVNTGGGDGMECAVDPFDARYSYTTLYYGSTTRYFNNGSGRNVASKGNNGITEDGAWVTPFLISEGDGNTMVIGFKNIWISRNVKSNGTISWTKISDNLAGKNTTNMSGLEQSPADFNLLFAWREDSKLFKTANLLESSVVWADITASLPVGGTPSDIECNPYDANIVYMVLNKKVYKSLNKGGAWTNISGTLPNISINTIVFDKSSNEGLYVGTDAGIYYKDADMADWVQYSTGFPVSVGVNELEIYQDQRNRADSRLRAGTFGRGVWEIKLANSSAVLPPALLTATAVDKSIELSWITPFYSATVQGYRIYKNGTFLTMVSGTSYTDDTAEPDITFTYKVTALYTGGTESNATNEAFATVLSEIVLPYTQQFENGPAGWSSKFTLEGWRWGTAETLSITNRSGHFFGANSSAAGNGVVVKDYLVTPGIDLTTFTGKTITLKFAYTMRKYRTYDKFNVNYRVDPDSAWVKLVDLKPPSTIDWVWDTTELNLPEKAMTKNMQIGFFYDNSSQYAWGAAVDDVSLFLNTLSSDAVENPVGIRAYPNPSNGEFMVDLSSEISGKINLKIINLEGQIILDRDIESNAGNRVEKLDMRAQAKGIYQLIIRSKDAEWKQKITIQ
jgi:photosystem II stability/assembly factor-like uncharacterized protein